MGEFGHVEGQDFEMLERFAESHAARMPQLAVELVQLKPDVILAASSTQAVALKKQPTQFQSSLVRSSIQLNRA
jgi:hypothetical protein